MLMTLHVVYPLGLANVNDSASEEVENIKVTAEENLMKLNLSKTKELVIRGRTTLHPPEPIVTIKRVSHLKLRWSDFSG